MPRKGQGRGLAAPIYVRLTPELHDALAALAEARGLTMAEIVRRIVERAVLPSPGAPLDAAGGSG